MAFQSRRAMFDPLRIRNRKGRISAPKGSPKTFYHEFALPERIATQTTDYRFQMIRLPRFGNGTIIWLPLEGWLSG